ncbi:hypothetical protein AMAG_03150 [Allomyces macrogynus ATCC 38327]|uniref:Uncharacterized protein n=1 Tax=Allomyces macrogynus (strain ATCC 38327) TaxID=578462 RepID=A0A0L0S4F7_ALLM3|nr:hypothetical protein AMAG_03150 [Allomyces macrogynus ATCC 38327]|eukprot:KNE57433.1 hypothetical protein AMAG_03150 [Allomyces macrogynus ATCC 38327]
MATAIAAIVASAPTALPTDATTSSNTTPMPAVQAPAELVLVLEHATAAHLAAPLALAHAVDKVVDHVCHVSARARPYMCALVVAGGDMVSADPLTADLDQWAAACARVARAPAMGGGIGHAGGAVLEGVAAALDLFSPSSPSISRPQLLVVIHATAPHPLAPLSTPSSSTGLLPPALADRLRTRSIDLVLIQATPTPTTLPALEDFWLATLTPSTSPPTASSRPRRFVYRASPAPGPCLATLTTVPRIAPLTDAKWDAKDDRLVRAARPGSSGTASTASGTAGAGGVQPRRRKSTTSRRDKSASTSAGGTPAVPSPPTVTSGNAASGTVGSPAPASTPAPVDRMDVDTPAPVVPAATASAAAMVPDPAPAPPAPVRSPPAAAQPPTAAPSTAAPRALTSSTTPPVLITPHQVGILQAALDRDPSLRSQWDCASDASKRQLLSNPQFLAVLEQRLLAAPQPAPLAAPARSEPSPMRSPPAATDSG